LIVAHARPDQAGQVQAYRDQVAALASGGAVSQPVPLGDIWQVTLVPKDAALASPTKALVKSIRALEPPFRADIGGVTAEFLDQRATLASRIPWAIAVLVGSTLILLFLMTGSVVLPIKAVLMNTLTVSATFGVLVMIFQWGNLTHLLAFESCCLRSRSPSPPTTARSCWRASLRPGHADATIRPRWPKAWRGPVGS
jgi:RND superfamily putative drug exporter